MQTKELYKAYHREFEAWFSTIHPNHNLSFDWVDSFDSGWYKEDMVNGAWIAWLALKGKH